MSWVSEVKDICGDYYIDVKYNESQKEAITLYFNSRRNAETVKRCIELDNSVPNVATAVDFVEVVRCGRCKYAHFNQDSLYYSCKRKGYFSEIVKPDHFCSCGERRDT